MTTVASGTFLLSNKILATTKQNIKSWRYWKTKINGQRKKLFIFLLHFSLLLSLNKPLRNLIIIKKSIKLILWKEINFYWKLSIQNMLQYIMCQEIQYLWLLALVYNWNKYPTFEFNFVSISLTSTYTVFFICLFAYSCFVTEFHGC